MLCWHSHTLVVYIGIGSIVGVLVLNKTRLRGLLVSSSYGTNSLTTLRATEIFILMHSGVVNGYQLLCNAHTVFEPHRGTAFFFLNHYCRFPLFLFMCLTLTVLFLFLGASIVCVNNLKMTANLALSFPGRTAVWSVTIIVWQHVI